jgi:hypothetical protein
MKLFEHDSLFKQALRACRLTRFKSAKDSWSGRWTLSEIFWPRISEYIHDEGRAAEFRMAHPSLSVPEGPMTSLVELKECWVGTLSVEIGNSLTKTSAPVIYSRNIFGYFVSSSNLYVNCLGAGLNFPP